MPINFHILIASKEIKENEVEIRSIAEFAVSEIGKILVLGDVDILFYDNPGGTIEEIDGIGGYTPNAHTILISLDPRRADFKKSLRNELFFTLAHELHHTVRWQKPVKGSALLEALVFEGLAEHFAMEVTARKTPSMYSVALTAKQKQEFMNIASLEWHKPTYDHDFWFFGSEPNKIPRWAGYTLGYDMVEVYLKSSPGELASKLALADATLFINNN